jgi:hypothetical protein
MDDVDNIPSADDLVFIFEASCFAHSLENLENTHAFAFAKVVGFVAGIVRAVSEDSGLWS